MEKNELIKNLDLTEGLLRQWDEYDREQDKYNTSWENEELFIIRQFTPKGKADDIPFTVNTIVTLVVWLLGTIAIFWYFDGFIVNSIVSILFYFIAKGIGYGTSFLFFMTDLHEKLWDKKTKKTLEEKQKEIEKALEEGRKKYEEGQKRKEELEELSFEVLDLLSEKSIVPKAYWYEGAIRKFKEYLINQRADSLKEAINLYEEELQREKAMQRMNQNYKRLMEQQEEYFEMQQEYAQQTANEQRHQNKKINEKIEDESRKLQREIDHLKYYED